MTIVTERPAAKRPARPFLPKVPTPWIPVLTSTGSKFALVGVLALAYVLQFGLGILTAVAVFAIRQGGELETQVYTTPEFVFTITLFGFVPFALSMLVVALYRRRAGWTWAELGIVGLPRGWFERRLWWRSAMVYVAALWASGILMALLSGLRGSGDYPEDQGAELARMLAILPESLMAGLGEELVLVGFLVVALERLGAKAPTIYVVAILMRLAFHLYYGPAAIGLILWAFVAVWIFRRTRLIVPLIIVHTLWDVNALSSEFVPILTGLIMLATLGAIIVTGIVHLVTRRRPDPVSAPASQYLVRAGAAASMPPPQGPPPGWYPDPSNPAAWRWWDGRSWTPHSSQP